MALRFGYQITCNIKVNPVFRKLSPNSSHRSKSHSPIRINNRLNQECNKFGALLQEKRTLKPICRNFSSKKSFDSEYMETDYENEYVTGATSGSDNRTNSRRTSKMKYKPDMISRNLQPSHLNPISCGYIDNTSSYLPESVRSIKVENLQRLANSQYQKAITALRPREEDETLRYQLESAKPKPERNSSDPNLYQWYKKRYPTREDTVKAPKFQPKNIKPYGEMYILENCGPRMKNPDLNLAAHELQNRKRQEAIERIKGRESQSEVTNHFTPTQHRHYCTINENISSTRLLPNMKKYHEFLKEYRKVNPEKQENRDGERLIKQENRTATIQDNQQIRDLKSEPTVALVPLSNDLSKNTIIDNQVEKRDVSHATYKNQLKIRPIGNTKANIILYYQERNGKKTLCSKVLKEARDDYYLPLKVGEIEDPNPIKARVGPKSMLQSMSDNNDWRVEDLTPAPNEKFTVPWLSWSDRVKRKQTIPNKAAEEHTIRYTTDHIQNDVQTVAAPYASNTPISRF